MRTSRILGVAALASASLLLVPPTVTSASPGRAPVPKVVSSAVVAPFNLAMQGGHTYFADGGLELIGRVKKNGKYSTIAAKQPGASGIAFAKNGRSMAFTTTVTNMDTFENTASGLHIWARVASGSMPTRTRTRRSTTRTRSSATGSRIPAPACPRRWGRLRSR